MRDANDSREPFCVPDDQLLVILVLSRFNLFVELIHPFSSGCIGILKEVIACYPDNFPR